MMASTLVAGSKLLSTRANYHVPIAHRSKAWLSLYYFGLQPIVLESWITSLTLLRNACIGASGMGIDIKKVTLLSWKPLGLAGKV